MSRITYYAELDPFSGTVGQSVASAQTLERDLRFAMLFYDVLLMPPRVMLEHAAVLPVAERLAPFVRAGRIGTSADKSALGPRHYIHRRADRAVERMGKTQQGGRSQSARRLRLEQMAERWVTILPEDWRVRRSISSQVRGVADTILQFCAQRRSRDQLAQAVHRLLDDHLQHDRDEPIRDMLLAGIASYRYAVSGEEFGRYSALIQSCYLHMGVAAHADDARSCHCFPGYFSELIQERLPRTSMAGALRPEAGRDRRALVNRLLRFGIDVEQLLALPAAELMELTTNEHWLALRAFLLKPQASAELEQEVAAALVRQNLRDGIHRAAALAQEWTPANETQTAAWQLPGQAALGAVRATRFGIGGSKPMALLNLQTSELRNDDITIVLTEQHKTLLSALAAAGPHGLAVQQVWQLLVEQDRLDGGTLVEPEPRHIQAKKRNADLAKHRLNIVLRPLGLKVISVIGVRGRWRLSGAVVLEGTAWHLAANTTTPQAANLSGQLQQLFATLAESWPGYRSVSALSQTIERTPERTSRVLARLKDRLRALNSEWALFHSDRRYRLVRSGAVGMQERSQSAGEVR